MKSYLILAIIAPYFLITSCHKKSSITRNEMAKPIPVSEANMDVKSIIVDPQVDIANIAGALTTVDSIYLTGDILTVKVKYSGGCQQHEFDLYSNSMYSKSLPPQLTLHLKHVNNDDKCRELVMKDLRFNVSLTRLTTGKSIRIKVGDKEVLYSYN